MPNKIVLDPAKLLGGLPDGSIQVAAGVKVGLKLMAAAGSEGPLITLDWDRLLGGLPEGSIQIAAGTRLPGLRLTR